MSIAASSDAVLSCIELDSALPAIGVEIGLLDDAKLNRISGAATFPVSHDLLSGAVEIGRLVSQSPEHHGLLLALGRWDADFCKQHVRLMGFGEQSGKELQKCFQGRAMLHEDGSLDEVVANYLLQVATHPVDHDGGVGASAARGVLQLPRAKFEMLEP